MHSMALMNIHTYELQRYDPSADNKLWKVARLTYVNTRHLEASWKQRRYPSSLWQTIPI